MCRGEEGETEVEKGGKIVVGSQVSVRTRRRREERICAGGFGGVQVFESSPLSSSSVSSLTSLAIASCRHQLSSPTSHLTSMNNWLDRLSIHSGPGSNIPPGRPYSPAPAPASSRNSLQLPPRPQASRPSLQTRSTSLNLVSHNELPASARISRESSLKNQLSQSPTPDTIDPLQALSSILGVSLKEPNIAVNEVNDGESDVQEKPSQLVEDIDFGDLSLQDFIERNAPRHAHRDRKYSLPPVEECMSFSPVSNPANRLSPRRRKGTATLRRFAQIYCCT